MSTPTLPGTSGLISNPTARIIIGDIFGWASLALSAAFVVDVAVASIDYGDQLKTASAILVGLFGLFQVTSTSPNVPTPKRLAAAPAPAPAPAPVIGVDTGIPSVAVPPKK